MNYKEWLDYKSKLEGRDVSKDEQDYDLEGYYNTLKANEGTGHMPDTFKKPNHPTFSDQSKYHVPVIRQGGTWSQDSFKPSTLNLENMPTGAMQNYFNEVENPEALDIENSKKMSIRRDALRNLLRK